MTENTTQHAHEMNKDGLGRYAEVHGLKMYYEIHGEGFPLVLLHGGLSTIDTSFGKVLPGLAGGTAGHRHRDRYRASIDRAQAGSRHAHLHG